MLLLTKQEIDSTIEYIKQDFPNNNLNYVTDGLNGVLPVFQTIHNYLLQSYPGSNQKPLAAAILLRCVLLCKDKTELTDAQIKSVITKTLYLFDCVFDKIRVSYTENENGNLLTTAAEILSISYPEVCQLFVSNSNNLPFIYLSGDENIEMYINTVVDFNDLLGENRFQNIPSDVNEAAITIDITSPPEHGQLNFNNSYVTYTPDADFVGNDYFEYRVYYNNVNISDNVSKVNIQVIENVPTIENFTQIPIRGFAPDSWNVLLNFNSHVTGNFDSITITDLQGGVIVGNNTSAIQAWQILTQDVTPGTTLYLEYRAIYNGNESNLGKITVEIPSTISNPFEGTTIDLCTESVQGRITYNLNLSTALNIDNVAVTSKKLIVPTATPNEVTSTTAGDMITPSGDMRTEIANIENTGNLYQLAITYDEDSVSKVGTITCALPHFAITDNLCSNAIVTTFEGLTL